MSRIWNYGLVTGGLGKCDYKLYQSKDEIPKQKQNSQTFIAAK